MENPAKKLKLSGKVASFDPFAALHEDLHQHIFQYLNEKDVMNAFLVSKQWNRLASKSSVAMSKILLNFREKSATDPSPREVTALLQSEREYQNIAAEFTYLSNAGRKLLLLQRFSPSIVDLAVYFDNKKFAARLTPDLSFSKLKTLSVTGESSTQFTLKTVQTAADLEKLTVNTRNINAELVNFIKQRKKLKKLVLCGSRESFFDTHPLRGTQLQLTSLSIHNWGTQLGHQAQTNFNNFVLMMAETLTTLQISCCLPGDISLVLNKLPALKTFKIYGRVFLFNGKLMQLKPNQTIKTLAVFEISSFLKQVHGSLTGLEDLQVESVNISDFEWIVRNIKGLKKLQMNFSSLAFRTNEDCKARVHAAYNQLKAEDPEINKNIEIIIVSWFA